MSANADSDEAVQSTNDDATLCKRSAVQLGYWKDSYLQYFVRATERKTPEINRGYYARVLGMKTLVDKAIECTEGQCQIINLGAGFDTLYWRLQEEGKSVKCFVEVDFPSVTAKKCHFIKRSKALLEAIASEDGEVKLSVFDLHGCNYHLIGCNLRLIDDLYQKLRESEVDFSLPTIIMSECVLVYMEPQHSHNLLRWLAEKFKTCLFINYEQVNMADKFGEVMIDNLKKRGCGLAGAAFCQSLDSQKQRFVQSGWQKVRAWLMTDVYRLIPQADVQRIEKIEMLDERELLEQLFQHYCLCVASKADTDLRFHHVVL